MLDPVHLTSSANPRVKHVLRLRQGRYRRRAGLFVAEGCRQIGRALDAGLRLVDLLWSPTLLGDRAAEVARLCRQAEGGSEPAGVYTVEPAVFGRMAYRRNPEGVLAVFESRQWALPAVLSVAGDGPGLWLVAVGLEKPGNLGALARSLAAAGGSGMLLADTVVDPMHPNALDASTGAVLSLPIATAATDEIIAALQSHQIRIIATTPGPAPGSPPGSPPGSSPGSAPGTTPGGSPGTAGSYVEAHLTGRIAVVIGPEDAGLDGRWLTPVPGAAEAVSIPMPGHAVDSLNASAAAAVVLFESVRQRREQGQGPGGG